MAHGVEGRGQGVEFVDPVKPGPDKTSGSKGEEWMARGNCRKEPFNVMFPSDGAGVEVARRICATCPVN